MVSWEPLTKRLAVGQAGTIGLSPVLPSVTVAGYWHNGDILTVRQLGFSDDLAIMGGDGFQSSIDAQGLTLYLNCNARFGGSICRGLPLPPFFANFKIETIWSDNNAWKLSDPHRQGHLLRLQKNGLVFRTTIADSAAASVLNTSDAWEAVDPFWGKTGTDHDNGFPQPRVGASTGLLPWYRYWPSLARLS
jgi:hypothetical protein